MKAPARFFVATVASLFVAELVTMWTLEGTHQRLPAAFVFGDALGLIAVAAPILYFLLYRPLTHQVRQRIRAERALQATREKLEERVEERTAQLESTNRRLAAEIGLREVVDERAHFQSSLLDAVEQAVVATDQEGRISYWNRFAETLYGWKAQEVEGRALTDVMKLWREDGTLLDLPEVCGQGASWAEEVYTLRRDGSRFPAHVACSPHSGCQGGAAGYVYLSFDITERKEAEEALRYSEEKYSTLVENSPTGIFISDGRRLTFVNPAIARMLEYDREEVLGVRPLDLVHPEDRDRVEAIAQKREEGDAVPDEYECRLITRTGQTRWVTLRNALVTYRGGRVVLGNVQDVTERREADRKLRESREALRKLSARLLSTQEEERRRVARDLHDSIGQSLSAIKFVVERALSDERPDERRKQILSLRSIVPTVQSAVEEVRRISMALRPSLLDDLGLLAAVGWFCREFQSAYPSFRVEQDLDTEEGAVPGAVKTAAYRILQEAMNNVAKHSGASHVWVRLGPTDGELELMVRDDGAGFDSTAGGQASEGFGLTSMAERAELSGGRCRVESTPGRGTTVLARWRLEETVSG